MIFVDRNHRPVVSGRWTWPGWRLWIGCVGLLSAGVDYSYGSTTIDLATYANAARIDEETIFDKFPGFAASCDVNGDGLPDLVVGAHEADGPNNSRLACGEAYVFLGRRGAWSGGFSLLSTRSLVVYGADSFDNLGWDTTCGDVNGDGFADLVLGAHNGAGPNNQRPNAGEVQVVFGGPALSSTIDLAALPSATTAIWGAGANPLGDQTGPALATGDLNGDGLGDIAVTARAAPGPNGFPSSVGRIYIVFGRRSWPPSIDLLTEANVTIYGASASDFFGDGVRIGDLNGDGTADLVVGARGADGPADSRPGAGEVYIFRGRSSWPASINMATTAPDTIEYGPDNSDQFSAHRAISIGDLDGDGRQELVAATASGAGPNNTAAGTGEARRVKYGGPLPSTRDLATQSDSVLYGTGSGIRYCAGTLTSDVNADGTSDLWCDSAQRAGPDGSRTQAGEVSVVYGRSPFPADIRLANGDADLVVYGAKSYDQLNARNSTDINGDGFPDMVLDSGTESSSFLGSLWIISPFDSDNDGVAQLIDNCPLVSNPSQLDSDGDRRGDICQTDWDGDGQVDSQDCAIADPTSGTPAEVGSLVFDFGSKTSLRWDHATFASSYDILRGTTAGLPGGDFGACANSLDPNLSDESFIDPGVPATGACRIYLVRARNARCKLAGSWGKRSDGVDRLNSNPSTCP